MKQTKTIVTPSLYVFAMEIEEAVKDGFTIDLQNNPPTTFGTLYECGMMKGDDVTEERETAPGQKLSRVEVLAAARAAKANKKLEATLQ